MSHEGSRVTEGNPRADLRRRTIGLATDGYSPRLTPVDFDTEAPCAPLLPETTEPEERFCTHMPHIEVPGANPRRSSADGIAALPFPDMVARIEAGLNQASLLLNDRIRTMQHRWRHGGVPSASQNELFEIADGIVAAAYHVHKWAHVLPGGEQEHAPHKPIHCGDVEEAFSSIRFALPRLTVSGSQAQRALLVMVQKHGPKAEEKIRQRGIPPEDLRAVVPHLERLIVRLGRLSSSVRPRTFGDFVVDYFAPVLGRALAKRLLPYIGADLAR